MARGKKIDNWKVTHEGVTVEVPVFMFKGDDYDGRKNFFQAEVKGSPPSKKAAGLLQKAGET